MFCENCGEEIKKEDKFCNNCGKSMVQNKDIDNENNKYKGLGGWLIVVAIGLFVHVFLSFYGIYEMITIFIDGSVDIFYDSASEYYIPGFFNLLIFEFIVAVLIFIISIYLIFLFFKKKKIFPEYYILFFIALVVFSVIDHIAFSSFAIPNETRSLFNEIFAEQETEALQAGIRAVIWIMYMKMSKRVKMTFIED
jgi:hypothetical protein